jgi:pimeloyl-ACP methyl ester carboxylesterase
MWQAITCPILFFHGSDTFMPNPASDGTLAHFAHARLINYDRASHWLHHDRLDDFVADLRVSGRRLTGGAVAFAALAEPCPMEAVLA